jgi:hypothetical protein
MEDSMIKLEEMGHMEAIYSFVALNGENLHIASGRVRTWCEKNRPEVFIIPMDEQLAAQFIVENSVTQARCLWLSKNVEECRKPVIIGECKSGPGGHSHYMIDGHHRYVVYAFLKLPHISCHILTESVWRQFTISGVPDITQEELKNSSALFITTRAD